MGQFLPPMRCAHWKRKERRDDWSFAFRIEDGMQKKHAPNFQLTISRDNDYYHRF
jgi:hypothetical protein